MVRLRTLFAVFEIAVALCGVVEARHFSRKVVGDLPSLNGAPGDTCIVQGYLAAGDGGGQLVIYTASGPAVDEGFTFDAPGGGNQRWVAADQSVADPMKFGAVTGATSAEVTDAFQDAIDAAATGSSKPVRNLDSSRVWTINNGLQNPNAVPIEIAGTIVTSDHTEPVITIGNNLGDIGCKNRVYRLNVSHGSQQSGTDADGVRVINCVDGEFHLSAFYCQSGVHFRGDDATAAGAPTVGACSRNHIWIGNISECFVGIHLEAMGEGGYVNDNEFYGGEIDTSSSMTTATELKGVLMEHKGSSAHYIDGNLFVGQSIELFNNNASALKFVFYADYTAGSLSAIENTFSAFRMESTSDGSPPGTFNTSNYRLIGGKGWRNNTFTSNFMLAKTNLVGGIAADDGTRIDNVAFNQFFLRQTTNEYVRLASLHPRQMVNTASGVTPPPHGAVISALELFHTQLANMSVTETEMVTAGSPRAFVIPIDMTGPSSTTVASDTGSTIVNSDIVLDETDKVVQVLATCASKGGRIIVRCYGAGPDYDVLGGADDCSIGPYDSGSLQYYLDAHLTLDGSGRPLTIPIGFGPKVNYALIGVGQFGGGGDDDLHCKRFEIFARRNSGMQLLNNETVINALSGATRYPIFQESDLPRSAIVPNSTECVHGTLVRNTSESELGAGVPVFWRFDKADGVWDEVGP